MSFGSWLRSKLRAIESDDDVFSDYIESILNSEDSEEDKIGYLQDVISGIMSDGIDDFIAELLLMWKRFQISDVPSEDDPTKSFEIDSRFYRLLEEQRDDVTLKPEISNTESSICSSFKRAILDQYAQVSDVEDNEEENSDCEKRMSANRLEVMKAEQERRERLKQEALQKRTKDKADREKQKELRNERKEIQRKRAQKVERH